MKSENIYIKISIVIYINVKISIVVLQIKYILLRHSGRNNVSVRYCNVVINGIQKRQIDISCMAAIRLFVASSISLCIRSSINKFYSRICSSCSLRQSHMRITNAYLLSTRDIGMSYKKRHT